MQNAIETLWGVAVADAIGNPLEFQANVSAPAVARSAGAPVLYPTDDTQLTLFNYEGLLEDRSSEDTILAWYSTQNTKAQPQKNSKGLLSFRSMYEVEAPGATCMASSFSLLNKSFVANDSKGNGTVMRASPFAVIANVSGHPQEWAFLRAKKDALTTHKHPFAWQASVLLVAIYFQLFRGVPLQLAVFNAGRQAPSCQEVTDIVIAAMNQAHYMRMLNRKAGWVAEEALALAVGANIHAKADFMSVVTAACQGVATDSDTVAGIAGGLAVARGLEVPSDLKMRLYNKDAIEYITSNVRNLVHA